MSMRRVVVVVCFVSVGCSRRALYAQPAPPRAPRPAWLKGQTHLHSGNSGDSHTAPDDVVRWYAARGYDFIVFTDHNVVTHPRPSPRPDMLVLPGVELTWNASSCGPPESPCNLHVNALFARDPGRDRAASPQPDDPQSRASIYGAEIATAATLGGVAQLNHPNYHYGADASLIARLARDGLRLVEFSNASDGCQNEGDASHPNTETLWNQVLSQGVDVWNVASDDAHHYDDADAARARGESVYTGDVGWVMVRASRDPASIRDAMQRGEFYASTGVRLDDIAATRDGLTVTVAGGSVARATTTFIVSPGRVLRTVTGAVATLPMGQIPADVTWVRATVDDGAGHRAWVQPLRVAREGATVRLRGPFGDEGAVVAPATPPTGAAPGAAGLSTGAVRAQWDTDSEAVDGRGAGRIAMSSVRTRSIFTLTYGTSAMTCLITGARCDGKWRGETGAGWFTLTFTDDGAAFTGRWGYDEDRANSGAFTGTRAP